MARRRKLRLDMKQLYMVGGAVRDLLLLGREPKDRDFVAVGMTPDDVLDLFPDDAQLVGKSIVEACV